ncbi:hypothetical protein EPN29_12760 [bacterium]|nr:MAG: hypothetical protein EPN29_12760 [bacterium]
MRNLWRKPLTWMVLGECAVVAALILAAWNVIAAATQPVAAALAAQNPSRDSVAGASAEGGSTPAPGLSTHRPPARSPLPGLNLDRAFWRIRLGQLNRDQVDFEQLEWGIVHSAMDAARRYLETVVLPSVERAERGGG